MTDTLELIRTACLFLFGIALSAILHGTFSAQPSGGLFIPIALGLIIVFSFALPEDLKCYGFLAAIAIVLGMMIWNMGWTESIITRTTDLAKSTCNNRAEQNGWTLQAIEQITPTKFNCKYK